MSDYRRTNYNREDPRLSRQNSLASPKINAKNSPIPNPNPNGPPDQWNAQTATYNHSQALQNAYQSLSYHNATGHQYPTQTYYTGYQNYSYNPYENYQAQAAQQAAYLSAGNEPRPPGEEYPQAAWSATNIPNYPIINEPPPAVAPEYNPSSISNVTNEKKKTDAVAEEKIKQLASLVKERETYEERVSSLKKKLKLLIDQKDSLSSKRSPDKDTLRIIKENTKLQVEIQSKIKDATNVIEILSNLIGDKKKIPKVDDLKPAQHKEKERESRDDKVNLKHYDPEIHWCRTCDVFPQSAKELLLHLHSKKHQDASQEEIPWHKLSPEPKFPTFEGAAVKRVPIKGLQFFVASTAWYCRLCDTWIGDLHCASQHLVSITHSQNYTNFVEQNPHWEIEWMKDREKAVDRVKSSKKSDSDSDELRRKRREKYSPTSVLLNKEKKKKKRSKRRKKNNQSSDDSSSSSSSSSSSDDDERNEPEDNSKSIRVAMRNQIKLLETDDSLKMDLLDKIVRSGSKENVPEDKLMSQWMTVNEPAGKEKQLLDNLKEKLKQKQDAEKARIAYEAEIARRKKELEEQQFKERERHVQDALVKEEEKKHREKMSLKLKTQPPLNAYRRSPPPTGNRSPDRRRRRSRSASPNQNVNRRNYRNGNGHGYERSPQKNYRDNRHRDERGRDRPHDRERDRRRSRSRSNSKERVDKDKKPPFKKLPFIGRMPLFKNMKTNKSKNDDDPPKREIQKEDYEVPRKTRFQPGNLARAFIPEPDVVCFPQLSSYPPCPPPPPPITAPAVEEPPEAPKISEVKLKPPPLAPPAPKIEVPEPPKLDSKAERALQEAAREEALEEEASDKEEEATADMGAMPMQLQEDHTQSEDYMLYEDTSNTMYQSGMYPDYNLMYANDPAYNAYMAQVGVGDAMKLDGDLEGEPEPPKSHTLPLEPPPLPPDDPNEDLAMLGLSSDDLAVQQMF